MLPRLCDQYELAAAHTYYSTQTIAQSTTSEAQGPKHRAADTRPQALGRLLTKVARPHDCKCGHRRPSLPRMQRTRSPTDDASCHDGHVSEAGHWKDSITYVHSHPLQKSNEKPQVHLQASNPIDRIMSCECALLNYSHSMLAISVTHS